MNTTLAWKYNWNHFLNFFKRFFFFKIWCQIWYQTDSISLLRFNHQIWCQIWGLKFQLGYSKELTMQSVWRPARIKQGPSSVLSLNQLMKISAATYSRLICNIDEFWLDLTSDLTAFLNKCIGFKIWFFIHSGSTSSTQ